MATGGAGNAVDGLAKPLAVGRTARKGRALSRRRAGEADQVCRKAIELRTPGLGPALCPVTAGAGMLPLPVQHGSARQMTPR